ncbi:hypothetical protein PUN28_004986 [Cardiocondyla obscurior]
MVDLYWYGILWNFKDISNFSRDKATIVHRMESGICDAAYLSESKFVIVEDSGAVQIQQIVESNRQSQFQQLEYACQHDDSVLTVSVFPNKRNIVTGGMDCCLKIWDTEDLISTYSYSYAHTDVITSTDVKPMCNSIFVSVSFDNESLLWDIRRAKPANSIFKKNNSPLSTVTWNSTLDHLIAIGTTNGEIVLIDVRQTKTPLHESVKNNRGIHKLLFNPNSERQEQLACCFDSEVIKIFDTNKEMLELYIFNDHSDFVRGLAWCKDDLYSCAWDGKVIKHVYT